MQSGIHATEMILFLLLLFVAAFATLARKLRTPYPIILVIAGLVLSFVPGIPRVRLNPEMVFVVVLPPLLYSAAWLTSWRDFYYNLVSIFLLAFGLVGFTVVGVAAVAHLVFPGFDWRLGVVLGAVVAPTDAIAATAIARRVGLPRRIVDVLEGESLVNDATALLALEFGLSLVSGNGVPSVAGGLLRLAYLVIAGLAVGLLLGAVVYWFEKRVDDGRVESVISLLVPYAAYLGAESIHASGVLSVVTCGLYLSRRSATFFSPGVRMRVNALWNSLTFILNGLIFVLIGLQMHYVASGIRGYGMSKLIFLGVLFSAAVIVLRLIWSFPGARVAHFMRTRFLGQKQDPPSWRGSFVVGWTGMRGVIALAAAMSLPEVLQDGAAFPQRNLIIFLTFCVILVTLVLQGLTLPPLIRALGLAGDSGTEQEEEEEARRAMVRAALDYLEAAGEREKEEAQAADGGNAKPDNDGHGMTEIYDDLASHYQHQLTSLAAEHEAGHDGSNRRGHYAKFLEASREVLAVEREKIIALRDQGRISDEVLRRLQTELDLNETRLLLADAEELEE
ncbi:MAG TPA: Na+/H+ antiporter [Candidatus Angelobacter sp.]|nr:Na+/H+ antiporter [Candidatus Angelobacter sp.]